MIFCVSPQFVASTLARRCIVLGGEGEVSPFWRQGYLSPLHHIRPGDASAAFTVDATGETERQAAASSVATSASAVRYLRVLAIVGLESMVARLVEHFPGCSFLLLPCQTKIVLASTNEDVSNLT